MLSCSRFSRRTPSWHTKPPMKRSYLWPYVLRPLLVVLIATVIFKLVVLGGGRGGPTRIAVDTVPTQQTTAQAVSSGNTETQAPGIIWRRLPIILIGAGMTLAGLWVVAEIIGRGYRNLRASVCGMGDEIRSIDDGLAGLSLRLDALELGRYTGDALGPVIERLEAASAGFTHFAASPPRPAWAQEPVASLPQVPHLIFDGPLVPWSRLAFELPDISIARTIETADGRPVEAMADAHGLTLPGDGCYVVRSGFAIRRLLISSAPACSDANLLDLLAFFAAVRTDGDADMDAYFHEGLVNLVRRIFYEDGHLVLPAGVSLHLLAPLLARSGFLCRIATLEPNDFGRTSGFDGRMMLEVFSYERQCWGLVDIQTNVRILRGDGVPVSATDFMSGQVANWKAVPFAPMTVFLPASVAMPAGIVTFPTERQDEAVGEAYRSWLERGLARVTYRHIRLEAGASDWLSVLSMAVGPGGRILSPDAIAPLFLPTTMQIETQIELSSLVPCGGYCFMASLADSFDAEADSLGHPSRSPWLVIEDDRPLGRGHASHDAIRLLGRGRFSHWKGGVYFASSDGSDPRFNGRRYRLGRLAQES